MGEEMSIEPVSDEDDEDDPSLSRLHRYLLDNRHRIEMDFSADQRYTGRWEKDQGG